MHTEQAGTHKAMVLTVIGDDRPGLVESVAQVVAEHEGNWIESRMTKLAGKFAGVLRVNIAEDTIDALTAALSRLSDLHVTVESAGPETPVAAQTLALELLGHDRPGIVREVSHALASRGINVLDLSTEVISAAMSGEEMFKAHAELDVPESTSLDELHATLDRICSELDVDITIHSH